MENIYKILEYLNQTALFLFGSSNIENLRFPYLIFLISTASVGILCVILDFTYYKITDGKSIFKLAYIGFSDTLFMFIFWGIGSGIIGFFTTRLGLMAFTIQSSIIIGLGWPLLFPKLYKYATNNINEKEPVEIDVDEIEEEPEEEIEEE